MGWTTVPLVVALVLFAVASLLLFDARVRGVSDDDRRSGTPSSGAPDRNAVVALACLAVYAAVAAVGMFAAATESDVGAAIYGAILIGTGLAAVASARWPRGTASALIAVAIAAPAAYLVGLDYYERTGTDVGEAGTLVVFIIALFSLPCVGVAALLRPVNRAAGPSTSAMGLITDASDAPAVRSGLASGGDPSARWVWDEREHVHRWWDGARYTTVARREGQRWSFEPIPDAAPADE